MQQLKAVLFCFDLHQKELKCTADLQRYNKSISLTHVC